MTIWEFLDGDRTHVYNKDMSLCTTWEEVEDGYYFHPLLSFSNLDDSTHVERSNVRVFVKKHGKTRGKKWDIVIGKYGSASIGIRCKADSDSILEDLSCLQEYPVLDDDDCAKMELEIERDAWDRHLMGDFIKGLMLRFMVVFDNDDDDVFWNAYQYGKQESGEDGYVTRGGEFTIRLGLVIEAVPKKMLESCISE